MFQFKFYFGTPAYGFRCYWLPDVAVFNLKARVGIEIRWLYFGLRLDWYRAHY